jgi:hypothetical protein
MKSRAREMARSLALFGAMGGFAFSGCGGDEEPSATQSTSPPVGRAPSATAPPGDSRSRTATAVPSERGRGPVPGGERGVELRAAFTLRGGRFDPASITAPPFLAIQVSAADAEGRPRSVTIEAGRTYRLNVPAGKRASVTIPGQPPGRYPLRSGAARATLVVGAES